MKKGILIPAIIAAVLSAGFMRAENTGVPGESEDVMLQCFYWDSYKPQSGSDSPYGRTKWIDLLKDTSALTARFDVLWFPPSAMAGGVGYTPKQYSNQDSDWGTKRKLDELIAALHRGGTKVLADVVINHRGNSNSWCTFYPDNFGSYGTYQLTQSHICSGDEGFTNSSSSCYGSSTRGGADTGTDFEGARDLDHSSEYVQNWSEAYLSWLLKTMHYDGFRYDMTRGYAGAYLSMYNEASQPYLSVSEFWMDNTTDQIKHLKETSFNTMVFDFPLKWRLGTAINGNAYGQLKNPSNSLRGKGYAKYAVTFIDNHDTFERSDNQGGEFYKYKADLSTIVVKGRILQAYTYILLMPGIPCVFWPHWKSYPDELGALIDVRKRAGIHSESAVLEESGQGNRYEATVEGHRGTVIFRIGAGRSLDVPEGYEKAADGGMYLPYSVFIRMNGPETALGNTAGAKDAGCEKFFRDGQLLIRRGEHVYDLTGTRVE